MEQSTHEAILARCVEALEEEADPVRRRTLENLLIEEEDRFGARLERLSHARTLMARGHERIHWQRQFIRRLEAVGADTSTARQLLRNLVRTQSTFRSYRRELVRSLERSHPSDRSPVAL